MERSKPVKRLGSILNAAALIAGTVLLGAGVRAPSHGPTVRILSLEMARSLGGGELAAYLASPDVHVAARAALAIGRTKDPRGDALLRAHLHDPRVPVRALSVYGLGLLATGDDGKALIAATRDPAGAVRVAAIDALTRYRTAGRLPATTRAAAQVALERALARDPSPIVRGRAAIALIAFNHGSGRAQAADALATAFSSDRALSVRRHAMWTIFRGYARSVSLHLLETALHDPDTIVRIQAVRAIGALKSPRLIAIVRPLLHDPSWRVQEQAAQSIRLLQGKALSADWTRIPNFVHLPPARPDPLARLPVLAWPRLAGKPRAPTPQGAIVGPALLPASARQMTQPAPGPHPRVRIVTTKGNVYVVLFPEWAPLTVENFLNLAARGYYNDNPWFRIVPDFVVQTGDPHGNGNGDAGYTIGAEENPLEQDSGVISMGMNYDARTNRPIRDSAGTQYYITLSPQFHLDWDFTVFGRVTSGFDVLGRLVESDRVLRIERVADAIL